MHRNKLTVDVTFKNRTTRKKPWQARTDSNMPEAAPNNKWNKGKSHYLSTTIDADRYLVVSDSMELTFI